MAVMIGWDISNSFAPLSIVTVYYSAAQIRFVLMVTGLFHTCKPCRLRVIY